VEVGAVDALTPALPRRFAGRDGGPPRVRVSVDAAVPRRSGEPSGCLVVAVLDEGPGLGGQRFEDIAMSVSLRVPRGGAAAPAAGMGLKIASRLAHLMGGKLELTDRTDGVRGAVLTLRLPLLQLPGVATAVARADTQSAPPVVTASLVRTPGLVAGGSRTPRPSVVAGAHILVADDSAANRRFASFALRALRCAAAEVDDGDGVTPALAAEAGTPIDAVIMDIVMPRLDGEAALAALRAAGDKTPVVACTANATHGDVTRYRAAGFAAVLPKPFKQGDLHDVLVHVLTPARAASAVAAAAADTAAGRTMPSPRPRGTVGQHSKYDVSSE
jgi:CheY-like chemotaxis protein